LSAGYSHVTLRHLETDVDYLDLDSDSVFLRIALEPTSDLSFGLESTLARNVYVQEVLNNSWNISLGPFARWKFTDALSLNGRGGYTIYRFDESGLVGPTADQSGFYFSVGVDHQIRPSLAHNLSASRSFSLGTFADLADVWTVAYGVRRNVVRRLPIRTSVRFENGTEGGAGRSLSYRRLGFDIGTSRQLVGRLNGSLNYQVYFRDGQSGGGDYTQNRLTLSLRYPF